MQRVVELLKAGDEAGILRLIADDPSVANGHDASGISLIMLAVYQGRRTLAEAVAAKRESLDIFEAASLGRIDMLRDLVRDTASVSAFSSDGFTALHFASYFGQPECALLLMEHGARADAVARNPMQVMPLHSAASARNLQGARLLLEHGAPVNARQQSGWVPIHAAAQNGDRPMVELLLEYGADPAVTNDHGQSPGQIARERGHAELADLLARSKGSV